MTFELQVLILYWLSNSALAWHIHHRSTVHNWTPRARYHSEKIQWERGRCHKLREQENWKMWGDPASQQQKGFTLLENPTSVLSFRAQNQRPYCSSFIWRLPPAHWILRCFACQCLTPNRYSVHPDDHDDDDPTRMVMFRPGSTVYLLLLWLYRCSMKNKQAVFVLAYSSGFLNSY